MPLKDQQLLDTVKSKYKRDWDYKTKIVTPKTITQNLLIDRTSPYLSLETAVTTTQKKS